MRYFFVLFMFFPITSYGQAVCSNFNFDFEKDINADADGWQGVFDSFSFNYDTVNKVQGKRSIVFTRPYLKMEFNLCLYRKILLPKPAKNISVSVFSKSSLLQYGWLKICGFNRSGKIVTSDSVSLLSENLWQQFTGRLNFPEIYLLSIELRAREHFLETKKEVKFWLDDINVSCDGKNLLSMSLSMDKLEKKGLAQIKKNIVLDDSLRLSDKILENLASKRIIGFGETAHGSLETEKFAYENIKQLISKFGCRLIFFEMNIDQVAKHNLFIQGHKVDTTYSNWTFISKEYKKLLVWLRNYNANNKEKVQIVGMDLHSNQLAPDTWNAFRHINSYLASLNIESESIDSIKYLVNNESRIAPLEYTVRNKRKIIELIGNLNFIVLRQILRSRTDTALSIPRFKEQYYYYWQQVHRDYTLWQNTKVVLDEFWDGKSPVAICSHYGHLDKITSIHFNEVTTLGQYLNQRFGKDYYHLGIILGEGQAGAMSDGKPVYNNLQFPPVGSIENLSMSVGKNYFFKEGFIDSKVPLTIRRMGNVMTKCQFIPSYFENSMDGFVFISKSQPSFEQNE